MKKIITLAIMTMAISIFSNINAQPIVSKSGAIKTERQVSRPKGLWEKDFTAFKAADVFQKSEDFFNTYTVYVRKVKIEGHYVYAIYCVNLNERLFKFFVSNSHDQESGVCIGRKIGDKIFIKVHAVNDIWSSPRGLGDINLHNYLCRSRQTDARYKVLF